MIETGGKIETFANRLKSAISMRETTAAELSRQTGLSKPKLSQYINGQYEAKQQALFQLAKVLDVSEAWLMGFDVPMERVVSADKLNAWDENFNPDGKLSKEVKALEALSIEERAKQILSGLTNDTSNTLMLDGKPASPEALEALKNAIEVGVELARRVNKDKGSE